MQSDFGVVVISRLTTNYLPITLIVVLGLIWGGVPSMSKYVNMHGVSPLSYSFWIFFFSASILLVINYIRTRRLPPRHLVFYVVCGVTGSALPTTVMFYALISIPAGLMVLLIAVTPIFTYVFAVMFRAERYHPLKTAGLSLAFLGIVLILLPDSVAEMKAPLAAVLLALLTPAFYAVNIVYTARRRPADLHIMELTTGMLASAAIIMLMVSMTFESVYPLWQAPPLIAGLTILHGILTATAFCLFYSLIRLSGALYSSQVTYSVTIIGVFAGAYVHDEVLPPLVWVAMLLMFLGIGIIHKARDLTQENQSRVTGET